MINSGPILTPNSGAPVRKSFLFVVTFAAAGVCVLAFAFGAQPPLAFEPEAGSYSGPVTMVRPAGASGEAVQFGITATPTPTPTSGARTCPAYPAPPDASCTGVPAGTALTTINGDFSTTAANQTVDSKLITGDVHVLHAGLTIKNTRIMGRIINDAAPGGLVVTDSDIGPDACSASGSPYNNFNGTNYTLIRSHVHNSGADLMGMGGQGTILIQDSIVNQACYYAGDHLDAIQFYSPGDVGHVTIQHSFLDSRAVNTAANGNSAIFWADNPGNGSTLTVTQSWLAGGNYTASLYDATAASGIILDINNTTFVNNSWTYGPCSSSNTVPFNGTAGLKFTSNRLDTGAALTSC